MKQTLPFVALCSLVILAWVAFKTWITPRIEADLLEKTQAVLQANRIPLSALSAEVDGLEVHLRGEVASEKALFLLKKVATRDAVAGARAIIFEKVEINKELAGIKETKIPETPSTTPPGEVATTTPPGQPPVAPSTGSSDTIKPPPGTGTAAAETAKLNAALRIYPQDSIVIVRGVLPDQESKDELLDVLLASLDDTVPLREGIDINESTPQPSWRRSLLTLIPEFFARTRRASIQIGGDTLTLKGEHYNNTERDEFLIALRSIPFSGTSIENRTFVAHPPQPSPKPRTAHRPDSKPAVEGEKDDLRMVDEDFDAILANSLMVFKRGQIAVDEEGKIPLKRLADGLAKRKFLRLVIQGHVDSGGDREYNRRLAGYRADAVQKALADIGVEPRKMTVEIVEPEKIPPSEAGATPPPKRRVNFKVN